MIDNAAEGCGTFSCAGWALLKGVYVVGTFGFASVHDPVRDAYDQGKVTGKQYVAYGIGGGAAAVAVNVATARVGGAVVQASGVVGRIAGSAAVGAAGAAASDAVSQGSQIGAGMKDHYDVAQTVAHAAVGAALGGGIAVVAETAAAAAPYIRSSAQKVKEAVADSTAAVKERFSETVAQTRTVVESAAQSVGSRIKGVVTREGGALGAEGSAVVSKGVAAEPAPQTWRITIGAKLEHEADKIGHAFVSVKPPEGAAVTKGLWPVKPNGQLGFDNVIDPIKGMPGVLRDDSVYLSSTKSVVKTYEVSEAQGMAALEKMAEIESKLAEGKMFYRLLTNQCATFACSVVKAAGVKPPKAGLIKQPRKIAESITREAK
jgi:hypothetical protein